MIADYKQAFEWLLGLLPGGIKLGLEQTRTLAELCGSPDRGLRFIHLAGTNGKGSTGAMLERSLRENGFKTGFYSSPHLLSACERIRINGKAVDEATFAAAVEQVKLAVEKMQQKGAHPTYFEALTVVGLLVFKQQKCDYVVWETGMGGRLDSTNIVVPQVSVITNIALDHEKFLGNTIEQIAGEKAGIIKSGVAVVSGCMPQEAENVIASRAKELGSPYFRASELAKLDGNAGEMKLNYQRFTCNGETIELQLNGLMQQRNAQLVIAVLKVLKLWNKQSCKGLYLTRWPARIEVIGNGKFILDGGHNPNGVGSLTETLKTLYPGKKFDWVFGAFADKDFAGGLRLIAPLARSIHAVKFAEEARLSAAPEDICKIAGNLGVAKCIAESDLAACLQRLSAEKSAGGEPVIIAGSLYLAGEVLNILEPRERVLDL